MKALKRTGATRLRIDFRTPTKRVTEDADFFPEGIKSWEVITWVEAEPPKKYLSEILVNPQVFYFTRKYEYVT